MIIASLSIDELAQRCATETEKYGRREPSDEQFCFELLRRALADGLSDAFTRVYQIYERRVLAWVLCHSRFAQTGESADYFAIAAWGAFYAYLRGARFAGFSSLAQTLAYLKLCVHTAIIQYLRDQRPPAGFPAIVPLDETPGAAQTPDLGAGLDAAAAWARVTRVLHDERDRLLAHCLFVDGLRPRQIVAAYPGSWRDEREVSVEAYRIRRLLRRDPQLRELFGLAGG